MEDLIFFIVVVVMVSHEIFDEEKTLYCKKIKLCSGIKLMSKQFNLCNSNIITFTGRNYLSQEKMHVLGRSFMSNVFFEEERRRNV